MTPFRTLLLLHSRLNDFRNSLLEPLGGTAHPDLLDLDTCSVECSLEFALLYSTSTSTSTSTREK